MKSRNIIFIVFALLILTNVLAWIAVFDLARSQYLEIVFFDVGQGDSIFIETPQQHQILIDGGPTPVVLEKLGKEMPFWDRTIDLVILTHPEKDHITGLLEVLRIYKVENILWTGVIRDSLEYKKWISLLEKEGANIFLAKAGQIICADCKTWKAQVLFPLEKIAGHKMKNSNNSSIVLKLTVGNKDFLLTGDIEKSSELKLLKTNLKLKADVLKIAHHGSKSSSIPEFIKQVNPSSAVISVGKDNPYGHPHFEVLNTLNTYGIEILRTDILGDIKFITDGTVLKLKTKSEKRKAEN